jgi:glycosyltransferase involved in cell wall biosynthesis
MHVVHVETGRHLYGGARQVLYLLEGLSRENLQSTLICTSDSAISVAATDLGIEVESMPMSGDLDFGFGLRVAAYLRRTRPDLVHVHSRRGADVWGGIGALRAAVPAVLTRRVDNPDVALIGTLKYRLYRRVVAISGDIRQRLLRQGVPADKLALVHSAVKAADAQPQLSERRFRQLFQISEQALVIAVIGQLIPRKGQAFMLAAWPEILASYHRARLILFGDGPDQSRLRRQAARAGIANSVIFAGYRADLHNYLGDLDLVVHPATSEGLGVCLLEAQAAGVPVVASRVGGIPEAVDDQVTGTLVPSADPEAMARAVIELLGHPERRARMGEAGRRHVARHFSVDAMLSGNLAVYDSILQTPGDDQQ